jgi:hypothetical protein
LYQDDQEIVQRDRNQQFLDVRWIQQGESLLIQGPIQAKEQTISPGQKQKKLTKEKNRKLKTLKKFCSYLKTQL